MKNSRGVSAVVATILLIAITVVAVGSIAIFMSGIGGTLTSPQVNANIVIADAYDGASSFTVKHTGGDDILNAFRGGSWGDIEIRVNGQRVYVPALDLNNRNVTGDENLRPGDIIVARPMFSGGSGTQDDPYIITNVNELNNIRNDLSAHYALGRDIDASETRTWNGGSGFQKIGSYSGSPFTGTLDGRGYSIKNLYMNWGSNQDGMFSYVRGRIENLRLENLYARGNVTSGGLIGVLAGPGVVSNCHIEGKVVGVNSWHGGLVGGFHDYASSGQLAYIIGCTVNVTVENAAQSGDDYGGLIGYMGSNTVVRGCTVNSYVKAYGQRVGGLVGYSDQNGIVEYCTVNSTVETAGYHAGGLVGCLAGTSRIIDCTVNSTVRAPHRVGGLVGGARDTSEVNRCAVNATVETTAYSEGYAGGLAGYTYGKVYNSYSTGTVTATFSGDDLNAGGLIGYVVPAAIVENCYSTASVSVSSTGASSRAGGLVGTIAGSAFVRKSYSTGNVAGGYFSGGICGVCHGTLENSYSSSRVESSGGFCGGLVGYRGGGNVWKCYSVGPVTGTGNLGGLIGGEFGGGSTLDSYWDTDTSGLLTSAGGTGKTTAEMMQQATYTGWDFTNTWGINDGASYPYLRISPGPQTPPGYTPPSTDYKRPKLKSGDVITVVHIPSNQVLASVTVS